MKTIQAEGDFHTVGFRIGEATSDDIRYQETHLIPDILQDAFGGDELAMRRTARRQHESTAEFWPEACAFLEGMARGAGMRLDALLPIAYCEEIAALPSSDAMHEKCSTLVVRSENGWVLGHQEDYLPSFYGRLKIYDLRIDGYPRMVSLNYPGTFPGVAGSLNAAGIATSNNSLWPVSGPGIAKQVRHFRATLTDTFLEAIACLAYPPHALTDHFTVIGGREDVAASLEVTGHPGALTPGMVLEIVHDRPEDESSVAAPFWHANHVRWLEPWASGTVPDPANRSSAMRARALQDICKTGAPTTVEDLAAFLTRRDGILNRDAEFDLTDAHSSVTLATTVIAPSQGEIRFYRYGIGASPREDRFML